MALDETGGIVFYFIFDLIEFSDAKRGEFSEVVSRLGHFRNRRPARER